jgi:hypothetical protein
MTYWQLVATLLIIVLSALRLAERWQRPSYRYARALFSRSPHSRAESVMQKTGGAGGALALIGLVALPTRLALGWPTWVATLAFSAVCAGGLAAIVAAGAISYMAAREKHAAKERDIAR